ILENALAAHRSTARPTPLGEAHAEFVRFKESENIEFRTKRSVLKRINHFVGFFGEATPLPTINLKQVEDYLNITTSAGNFNTWRQHVNTFFNFCVKKHRWIQENPIDRIPLKKIRVDVETFGAPQIENLLRATYTLEDPEGAMMRLYVILGVFAGLRPEEAQRLRWEDINFEDDCIVISKMRSKTSRPRSIPFEPNFKKWLNTIPRENIGPVYNQKNHRNQFNRLMDAAGLEKSDWIQDGLRHTYGSARWLLDKDMYRLARQMGNSERVCIDHYLSTSMTKAAAQAIFAIQPPAGGS
ncbi:MAG: tyrosine-type recombinase/integrase, partial [Verrucomicrobiota bacterium]